MHSAKSTDKNQQLTEYYTRLGQHDWTYMMSDNNEVYRRGKASEQALRDDARRLGEQAEQMYADVYAQVWHGGAVVELEKYLEQT